MVYYVRIRFQSSWLNQQDYLKTGYRVFDNGAKFTLSEAKSLFHLAPSTKEVLHYAGEILRYAQNDSQPQGLVWRYYDGTSNRYPELERGG